MLVPTHRLSPASRRFGGRPAGCRAVVRSGRHVRVRTRTGL